MSNKAFIHFITLSLILILFIIPFATSVEVMEDGRLLLGKKILNGTGIDYAREGTVGSTEEIVLIEFIENDAKMTLIEYKFSIFGKPKEAILETKTEIKNVLSNTDPEKEALAYIKLNATGHILEADFTSDFRENDHENSSNFILTIKGEEFEVPPLTRIQMVDGKLEKLSFSDLIGFVDLGDFPGLQDFFLKGNMGQITGKHIKISDDFFATTSEWNSPEEEDISIGMDGEGYEVTFGNKDQKLIYEGMIIHPVLEDRSQKGFAPIYILNSDTDTSQEKYQYDKNWIKYNEGRKTLEIKSKFPSQNDLKKGYVQVEFLPDDQLSKNSDVLNVAEKGKVTLTSRGGSGAIIINQDDKKLPTRIIHQKYPVPEGSSLRHASTYIRDGVLDFSIGYNHLGEEVIFIDPDGFSSETWEESLYRTDEKLTDLEIEYISGKVKIDTPRYEAEIIAKNPFNGKDVTYARVDIPFQKDDLDPYTKVYLENPENLENFANQIKQVLESDTLNYYYDDNGRFKISDYKNHSSLTSATLALQSGFTPNQTIDLFRQIGEQYQREDIKPSTLDDYYQDLFENYVPNFLRKTNKAGFSPEQTLEIIEEGVSKNSKERFGMNSRYFLDKFSYALDNTNGQDLTPEQTLRILKSGFIDMDGKEESYSPNSYQAPLGSILWHAFDESLDLTPDQVVSILETYQKSVETNIANLPEDIDPYKASHIAYNSYIYLGDVINDFEAHEENMPSGAYKIIMKLIPTITSYEFMEEKEWHQYLDFEDVKKEVNKVMTVQDLYDMLEEKEE